MTAALALPEEFDGGLRFSLANPTPHAQPGVHFHQGAAPEFTLVVRCTAPLRPFVTPIGPQAVGLCLTDPVVSQQGVFDFCRLPRRCTQPVQNRVFLDPFGARYAADTDPFRQQRQCFHYRLR